MTFILTNYIIFNLDIYFTYYIIIEKKNKIDRTNTNTSWLTKKVKTKKNNNIKGTLQIIFVTSGKKELLV